MTSEIARSRLDEAIKAIPLHQRLGQVAFVYEEIPLDRSNAHFVDGRMQEIFGIVWQGGLPFAFTAWPAMPAERKLPYLQDGRLGEHTTGWTSHRPRHPLSVVTNVSGIARADIRRELSRLGGYDGQIQEFLQREEAIQKSRKHHVDAAMRLLSQEHVDFYTSILQSRKPQDMRYVLEHLGIDQTMIHEAQAGGTMEKIYVNTLRAKEKEYAAFLDKYDNDVFTRMVYDTAVSIACDTIEASYYNRNSADK